MKIIPVIFIGCFFFFACKKSNTDPPKTPTLPAVDTLMSWTKSTRLFGNVEDIWFRSSGIGFLVDDTSIYTSADRGVTWTIIPNTTGSNAFNLQFLNDELGFAQSSSTIEVTTDGGQTWTLKQLNAANMIYSQFVSEETGFYADPNTGIFKTIDGGNTWTQLIGYQWANESFPFYFIDSLRGFTMADNNFSKTTDGGTHWQVVASTIVPSLYSYYSKLEMFDSLAGFYSSAYGILKTIDGGKTWVNTLPIDNRFSLFQFIDRNNGFGVIDNSIFKTTDGGETWIRSCKLGTDSFSGIHFLDMDHGWASTFGGYILTLN